MPKKFNPESKVVLTRMNELLNLKRGFQAGTQRAKELDFRLKDYPLNEVLEVVEFIWSKWKNWDQRIDHFNPSTLFRKRNFEKYHEDCMVTKERKLAVERTVQTVRDIGTANGLSACARRFMASMKNKEQERAYDLGNSQTGEGIRSQ